MTRYLVIGGGIAGASVASHLALATDDDAEVLVLERGSDPAAETTAKSGSFVGHWGHESATSLELLRYGIGFYDDLLSGPDAPTRYVHGGRLRVATTEAGARALRRDFKADHGVAVEGSRTTAEKGAPVQYLDGPALAETLVLPDLATDEITGAIYSPTVGYVADPAALARGVLDRAMEAGASVRTGVTVTDLVRDRGRVVGVEVDAGATSVGTNTIQADEVICAAGPWNRTLLSTAGVDLPVRHTRGPMTTLEPRGPHHAGPALLHEETGFYTRPTPDRRILAGHYPGEYDAAEPLDPDAVPDEVPTDLQSRCLDAVATLLPRTADAPVADEWVGVRSHTPDGEPIVGPTVVDGLSVVAFNAAGIQFSPAAGWILARQLVGNRSTPHDDAVSPARFEGSDRA